METLHVLSRVRVYDHSIPVSPGWWTNALARRRLPGGPLEATYDSEHGAQISRRTIFELAARTDSPDGVLRLLWHTLAWGGGRKARLMSKRLDSVAANPERAVSALRDAATAAPANPADAYKILYPAGRTVLKYLGPAFFTKYLYFAGGGAPAHPCAILDSVVATNLQLRGWVGLRSAGWSDVTYGRYCGLLASWAREASKRIGRPVAADEFEFLLYRKEASAQDLHRAQLL